MFLKLYLWEEVRNYTGEKLSQLDKPIEYVIYCRKSSESDEKQSASIGKQIQQCLEYAKKDGLTIRKKPEDFPFETPEEILKENTDKDLDDRALYKKNKRAFYHKGKP